MKRLPKLLQPTIYLNSGIKALSHLFHSNLIPEDVNKGFHEYLPKITDTVVRVNKYLKEWEFTDKIQKASKYNMESVNNIGGAVLIHAYNMLSKTSNTTEKSFQQAFVLAWAVEMVQSHNLMVANKRNKNSIEKNGTMDTSSLIDAELLRSSVHIILEEHFGNSMWFKDFLKLYNQAFMFHVLARHIEHASPGSANKYLEFNEERYDLLCEYQTGYQSFTLPLSLAMTLANRTDENLRTGVKELCSQMGKLYQMKKDYDNCFGGEGTVATISTAGTDIQRGRCAWPAVAGLQRFSQRQRAVFAACYASAEPAHVERVKLLYQQVQLPQQFRERQTSMLGEIEQKARHLEKERSFPSCVFLKILDEVVCDKSVKVNIEPM